MRGGTIVDRVAGLYVSNPKGELVASAGRDVNLIGALISNSGKEGTTEIGAGRDINLGTVTTARQEASIRSAGNYRAEASTQEVGTRIETRGDISLSAGRDVNARAATVNSTDGELGISAKRDINIDAGQSTSALNEGLHVSGGGAKRIDQGIFNSTAVIGSSLGGKTVVLDAGNDIRIRGSDVVSDKGTELWADNNITIEAATQTRDSQYVREESKSGMFDSGSAWTWGRQDTRSTRKTDETAAVGSTVGAISGNVIITAGNRYSQVGSDVIAPGGDIDILARDVQIVEARENSRSESTQSFSQSGITLGIKAPLIDTLRNLEETTQAMGDTKDDRMKALGAASMALSGYSAYRDISQAAAAGAGYGSVNMGATLTLGSSSSETTSTQSSNTSSGSRVQAGGNVFIAATGGGQDSNILVRGSEISGGKNVSLAADNDVTLEAAANSKEQSSTSRSSNSSIGVGYSFGTSNGFTIEVAARSQSGRDNGTDGAWTNTTVSAGRQVNIISGGDTTLRGATVSGKRVEADVGGNLHIETLQDTSTYHSQNSGGGGGFSATLCVWWCVGDSSASVSAHSIRGDGDFASATVQSGFLSGDSGFGVKVAGNTNLVGGVISSTDAAVDAGRNNFASGSLTMSDLQNHDVFRGSGYSVSASTSTSGTGSGGLGIGSKDVNQTSTTRSGISGIAGNTAVRTGVDSTNALRQTDFDRAMRDVGAQVQLTAQFGVQATRAVGSYADQKFQEAVDNKDAEGQRIWGANGPYRVALHASIGALTGGVGGAVGATASSLSITEIGALIYGLGLPTAVAQGLSRL
ncbi:MULTISPECIES: hemagglutinin repeat-containing protein [unclassified Variovorax]|uniref:hemagglutinin repeat-containing protein n=1 Tax=unclassified Variovorax TaxID=663243 RepID=UPI003F45796A